MKVHCKMCDSLVPAYGVHSCFDAALLKQQQEAKKEAERAVIGTVKQFLSIYNNEKVSDPNAAAWAIGEMESAVATLRDAAEKEDARLKRTEQRHEAERAVVEAAVEWHSVEFRAYHMKAMQDADEKLYAAVAALRELEGEV